MRGSVLSIIIGLSRGLQFLAPVAMVVAPSWSIAGGIALAAGFRTQAYIVRACSSTQQYYRCRWE